MAVLLNAATDLAHVVVGQAHGLLPEGELFVPFVGEQADVEMLFGKMHDFDCSADFETTHTKAAANQPKADC